MMGTNSINEPDTLSRDSHRPASINEPPTLPPVPAPVVSSLDPDTCAIGDADFVLEVHGENFFSGSVIFFAGHQEPTTWDEAAGTVSTGVKPSLWTSPAVVKCSVFNGEQQSNEVDFTFTDAAAPLKAKSEHPFGFDPDELEEQIEEAEDEGDFKPTHATHRGKTTHTLPGKRKK